MVRGEQVGVNEGRLLTLHSLLLLLGVAAPVGVKGAGKKKKRKKVSKRLICLRVNA